MSDLELARRIVFMLNKATTRKSGADEATTRRTKKNTTDELEDPPPPPTLPWCDDDEWQSQTMFQISQVVAREFKTQR